MINLFKNNLIIFLGISLILILGCNEKVQECSDIIKPTFVTEPVKWDSDDPAIWINKEEPSKSLIIGTDKETDGAIYVFNLEGKIIEEKTVRNIKRPNNVDVEYGLMLNGTLTDIAVTAERETNSIRVFSLPDMKPVDNGGIAVFAGE